MHAAANHRVAIARWRAARWGAVDGRVGDAQDRNVTCQPLTYAFVGATRPPGGPVPPGFNLTRHRALVGHGQTDFDTASLRLHSWDMQRRAGLRVQASGPAAVGQEVVLRLGIGRAALAIPCRVVWTIEVPRRRGFGYGTLPGHPFSGEEGFLLEIEADGSVIFTVQAYSRPARWYSRAAGPLTVLVQQLSLRRYAAALRPRPAG